MHHPWRALRALTDWSLLWAELPGDTLGVTDWRAKTITLRAGMLQRQRRATLAHELHHVARGPAPECLRRREEMIVERDAARQMIDLHALGEALAWSHHLSEVADELWVDEGMVRSRLDHLHPAERAYLRRRLNHEHNNNHEQW
jgi:hypothetical protein